jgi:hypothetical protein
MNRPPPTMSVATRRAEVMTRGCFGLGYWAPTANVSILAPLETRGPVISRGVGIEKDF